MKNFLRDAMERAQKAHEERLAAARDLDALPDSSSPLGGARISHTRNAHGLGRGCAPPISTCMAILRARREGVEIEDLAARFGVSTRTIQRLTKRATAQEQRA